jgi:hypothetical protein
MGVFICAVWLLQKAVHGSRHRKAQPWHRVHLGLPHPASETLGSVLSEPVS